MAIGPKRLVVGAHYGLRDWLVQRVTAVVLALFLLVLLASMMAAGPLDYDAWAGVFVPIPMKLLTVLAALALGWHAWIGMRDIWMDYVTAAGVRLVLQVGTVLWLVYCVIWTVQILWRV